ncbi:MAG: hypothetical protein IMZ53_01140 [Thermoplasmata archaeon]|nr:hypothetical protein [Thermoplasmata archaeon]
MTVHQNATYIFKSEKMKPQTEYKFHPFRKWRFDFAFPEILFALEIEGGVWSKGRHTRGTGFIGDIDKYNEATMMGWRVLRAGTVDQALVAILYIKEYRKEFSDIQF